MNLRISKIQGYNNNALIAPASADPSIQVDVNMAKPEAKPVAKKALQIQAAQKPTQQRGTKPTQQRGTQFQMQDDDKDVLITTGVGLILAYIWLK